MFVFVGGHLVQVVYSFLFGKIDNNNNNSYKGKICEERTITYGCFDVS